jgi:hypothetical protein
VTSEIVVFIKEIASTKSSGDGCNMLIKTESEVNHCEEY